jgi:hypothetical protein
MGKPLVIYDFAPDPSEFPNKLGKFDFLLYQCMLIAQLNQLDFLKTKLHSSASFRK